MTAFKHNQSSSEDALREILNEARNRAGKGTYPCKAITLWMTDCAARTLHIYETVQPEDMRVRSELVRAQLVTTGEILFQPAERMLSWANLQDIAHQTAHQNFAAAAWAVRSVAWTLRGIKTAWNCAAASVNAVRAAFPGLDPQEITWQTNRLTERFEDRSLTSVQPGKYYHP